ncbi:hypothetical protein FQN55_006481 [Onygenales sp. PD_40]|nr:hypothetical protein FQN55_006481 [Onygenales sp. PD_40]KAK2781660.1 hypothetical protein FQN53_000451 [Emmonsiellopsis sp. PD_33]KAK2787500.1 hypothetical protein FQN52_007218 [Onygenales sp. PD_12]KAK2798203.1 hypothetical protein FQN51_007889 [Onygenales sp. PD_10]
MVVDSPDDGPVAASLESMSRKWRGKLFSKEKQPKISLDAQVDDFLGNARSTPSPLPPPSSPLPPSKQPSVSHRSQYQHPQQPQQPPPRQALPSAPRLNVAISKHWPDSSDLSNRSPTLPSLNPRDAPFTHPTSPPKKKRDRKGLRVAFTNGAPDIIGEGGEEADDPTKDVVRVYRSRSHSAASNAAESSHAHAENADPYRDDSATGTSWDDSHPGKHGSPDEPSWKPLMKNAHEVDFLLSIGSGAGAGEDAPKRLSFRDSGDPNSFARRVQERMRAEEGQALQQARPDSPTAGSPQPHELELPPNETILPMRPSVTTNVSDAPRQERSPDSGSFWGSIMSALPSESRSNWQTNNNHSTTPTPTTLNNSHPATPPPPYLRQGAESAADSVHSVESQPPNDAPKPRDPVSMKKAWKAAASQLTDGALADFSTIATQYNEMFSIAAENVKPSMETSLSEWVRASVWWFLKGRADLESSMRSQPSSAGGNSPPGHDQTKQGVLNLAKSWWINQHIVPQHPELSRFGRMSTDTLMAVATTAGDQRISTLLGLHQTTLTHLRALALSMKRNNILPSALDGMNLPRGIDTAIWVRYPFFAPDISAVLSGNVTRSMLVETSRKVPDIADVMPLGDTNRFFSYGRMFVEVYLSSSEDDSQQYAIPCVLSIVRDRTEWNVLASITSQNELVNIMIQGDKKQGPTWADVEWQVRTCSMRVRLPRGFELDVQFAQPDFKTIWKIVEYTHKTEESLQPEAGETLLFEDVLKTFQYMDSSPTKAFPPESSPRCRIRLFEKSVTITEGTGSRKAHRGFRFIAVTSPKVKTLSSVTHILGDSTPIVFGYLRGDDGAPALLIKIQESGASRSMLLTFHEQEERAKMHSLLLGVTPLQGEVKTPDIPMRSFLMEQPADKNGLSQAVTHLKFSSPSAAVINIMPGYYDHGHSSTILSEHLRVFVTSNWGSVTDRINIGPGEMKIGLDVNIPTGMSIMRPGQLDLGVSVAENLVPKEMGDNMLSFMKTARTTPIIRRYNFSSVQDLHRFQQAVTGFKVLFDGTASLFTISRRRMVVPIYKKWEATKVRLQVIEQEKIVQLVAFFADFSHGQCMNFVLKSTDIFETFNHRSGKFGVKIVDAKFALPKPDEHESAGFVCLDFPEYPAEHDDITIAFDSENDRADFQSVMPGSVKEPSRMGSLRK